MTSPWRRVLQLARALRTLPLNEAEIVYVRDLLNERQAALYFALVPSEQRHALNVCQTLLKGGFGYDRELLQAALLHDLGKRDFATNRHVPVWGKVISVALEKIGGPNLVARLAKPAPQSWRYIFHLQAEHEARGATLAREAGSSPKVIALIGDYQSLYRQGDPAALALQWADDLN